MKEVSLRGHRNVVTAVVTPSVGQGVCVVGPWHLLRPGGEAPHRGEKSSGRRVHVYCIRHLQYMVCNTASEAELAVTWSKMGIGLSKREKNVNKMSRLVIIDGYVGCRVGNGYI